MAVIHFQGKDYSCGVGQNLLDCLQSQGGAVSSGCRSGICQSCLLRVVSGTAPPEAQQGLSDVKMEQGYFLACRCQPQQDMSVALPDTQGWVQVARVMDRQLLNREMMALRLRTDKPFGYRAGQYLRLFHPSGISRCYSLASVPALDGYLEFHVRKIPGGKVSGWVHDTLGLGDEVSISDPMGECVYSPAREQQPLLLLGTGSGLAPLFGVLRDALEQHHIGELWLYHGSVDAAGLYYQHELQNLARQFPNFHYIPCVDHASPAAQALAAHVGIALDRVMMDHASFVGYRVYLCGHPAMVEAARMKTFLAGASMNDILADPFFPSGSEA